MIIRMARNAEGEQIRDLLVQNGFKAPPLRWDDVEPFWLVAEHEGLVVGCIQVLLAKPFGHLEMLATVQNLPHRVRAVLIRDLLAAGSATLQKGGAQYAVGLVPFEMKTWKRLLKRRGWKVVSSGNQVALSLEMH